MKRENIKGRANVEDTPELDAYYRALEGAELGALWNVANEIEPWYPQPKTVPTMVAPPPKIEVPPISTEAMAVSR